MPFVIPVIVAIATSIGVGGFISIGLGILQHFLPKPSMATRVSVREALASRRTVYGFYHGPGIFIYAFSDGQSKNLEEIWAFASHECFKVGDLYLDNLRCFPIRSGDGMVLGGQRAFASEGGGFPFAKVARFRYKTGAADNIVYNADNLIHGEHNIGTGAFPVQASNFEWTSACVGNGICAVYVALTRDDHFNGLPSVAIDLWGKKIYDPRDTGQLPGDSGTWKWSDNPALCYLDYLTTARLDGGYGATLDDMDLDLFIAAANVCDETVDVLPSATTIYSIDATGVTNQFQVIVNDSRGLFAGMTVTIGGEDTTIDSMAGGNSFICLLTGTHVSGDAVVAAGGTEKRYTCNGFFTWDMQPAEIMSQLLSSMGGIPVDPLGNNGKYGVYAAAWRPPTITLTDADARGPMKVQTLKNARDLCNGVRVTFINNFQGNWQPDDAPPVIKRINPLDPSTTVANDYYLAQDDGFRRWHDQKLPFTTSPSMAQRIGRITLEQNRRQITVEWKGKMSCYQLVSPDVMQLSRARFEWTDKTFQAFHTQLVLEHDKDSSPYFGVDLTLQETDAAVYDFDGEQFMTPLITSGPPPSPTGQTSVNTLALSTYVEP